MKSGGWIARILDSSSASLPGCLRCSHRLCTLLVLVKTLGLVSFAFLRFATKHLLLLQFASVFSAMIAARLSRLLLKSSGAIDEK